MYLERGAAYLFSFNPCKKAQISFIICLLFQSLKYDWTVEATVVESEVIMNAVTKRTANDGDNLNANANMLLLDEVGMSSSSYRHHDMKRSVTANNNNRIHQLHQSDQSGIASAQLIRFVSDKDALIVQQLNEALNKNDNKENNNESVHNDEVNKPNPSEVVSGNRLSGVESERAMNLTKRNTENDMTKHRKAIFHRKGLLPNTIDSMELSLQDQVHVLSKQLNALMMHHQKDYKMLKQSILNSVNKKLNLKCDELQQSNSIDSQKSPSSIKSENSSSPDDHHDIRLELQQLR